MSNQSKKIGTGIRMMELYTPSNPEEKIELSTGITSVRNWLNKEKVRIENRGGIAIIINDKKRITLWVERKAGEDVLGRDVLLDDLLVEVEKCNE